MADQLRLEVHCREDKDPHSFEADPLWVEVMTSLCLFGVPLQTCLKSRFGIGFTDIYKVIVQKYLVDALFFRNSREITMKWCAAHPFEHVDQLLEQSLG
jgi:hypothetical protein